jgi:hypothetical protein
MKIIADLAAGLGSEHRNRRERTAQKFTMDASNAAEQKISTAYINNNLFSVHLNWFFSFQNAGHKADSKIISTLVPKDKRESRTDQTCLGVRL